MKHAGEIVKQVVEKRGISISALAKRMGKSRPYIYNLFEKTTIDTATIFQLSEILDYPFTELLNKEEYYREYKTGEWLSESQYKGMQEILEAERREKQFWKDKYTELLEQMNRLLLEKGK